MPVFLALELREHNRSDMAVYIALCKPGCLCSQIVGQQAVEFGAVGRQTAHDERLSHLFTASQKTKLSRSLC